MIYYPRTHDLKLCFWFTKTSTQMSESYTYCFNCTDSGGLKKSASLLTVCCNHSANQGNWASNVHTCLVCCKLFSPIQDYLTFNTGIYCFFYLFKPKYKTFIIFFNSFVPLKLCQCHPT